MSLLAYPKVYVDPGSAAIGWTGVSSMNRLIGCGLIRSTKSTPIIDAIITQMPGAVETITMERPVVYPRAKQEANPNDLINIAVVGGIAVGVALMRGQHRAKVEYMAPGSWKGQVDGDIMAKRIFDLLTTDERALYLGTMERYKIPEGSRHNVLDSIGLWMYEAMRL